MKSSRFQFEYRDSASSLHKAIGEILRNSEVFKYHECYQEYPVNRVNNLYPESSHHYDWVIPKLKIVVEGHGKQHYSPVAFDGDAQAAVSRYHEQKRRDKAKKKAALDANYIFVEVPWHTESGLTEVKLLSLYEQAKLELEKFRWEYHREEEQSRWEAEQEKLKKDQLDRKEKVEAEHKEYLRKQREEYLASEKHRQELLRAREHRAQQYRRLKEQRGK